MCAAQHTRTWRAGGSGAGRGSCARLAAACADAKPHSIEAVCLCTHLLHVCVRVWSFDGGDGMNCCVCEGVHGVCFFQHGTAVCCLCQLVPSRGLCWWIYDAS
jgi:hypothetical protein